MQRGVHANAVAPSRALPSAGTLLPTKLHASPEVCLAVNNFEQPF